MKHYIIATSEPIKPLDPKTYQGADWGLIIFSVLLAPLILAGAKDFAQIILRKVAQKEKQEDSKQKTVEDIVKKTLEDRDAFIASYQEQNKQLMHEVLSAREEDIKNLQATQATMVQVLATVAENLKAYAQMAVDRSNETKVTLEKIRTASESTVIQSMNSHIKLTRVSIDNQTQILAAINDLKKIDSTIIELLDAIKKQ